MNATATYPEAPGWKTTSTETSRAAAQAVKPAAAILRDRVLGMLKAQAMTADEVAQSLGVDKLSVRPRVSELKAAGKVFATAKRRCNASGKSAVVWRGVQEAVQEELI